MFTSFDNAYRYAFPDAEKSREADKKFSDNALSNDFMMGWVAKRVDKVKKDINLETTKK